MRTLDDITARELLDAIQRKLKAINTNSKSLNIYDDLSTNFLIDGDLQHSNISFAEASVEKTLRHLNLTYETIERDGKLYNLIPAEEKI